VSPKKKHAASPEASMRLGLPESARTAWHPMFVALLERRLQPGYRLVPELQLSREPLRADVVVIRLEGTPAGEPERLRSILTHLSPHTLIQFKGPTTDLEADDVLVELVYAPLYMLHYRVTREDLGLILVADHLTPRYVRKFKEMGGRLERIGRGVWQGGLQGYRWHGVEAGITSEHVTERLSYAFTKRFLREPTTVGRLDAEDTLMYIWLCQKVEQFRKERGVMSVKNYDEWEEEARGALREVLASFSIEERLEGISPEEVLSHIPLKDRLRGVSLEDRLKDLSPEELEQIKKLLH